MATQQFSLMPSAYEMSSGTLAKQLDSLKYQMTFHTPMALMKIIELPYYDRFSDILILDDAATEKFIFLDIISKLSLLRFSYTLPRGTLWLNYLYYLPLAGDSAIS